MTDNVLGNWSRFKADYTNQDVRDTPIETRPAGSIGAVDHFSKKATLRQYDNPEGYAHTDGIPTRGEYTLLDFWCVIKPATRGGIDKEGINFIQDIDGEHADGQWLLMYNPRHEKHIKEIHLNSPTTSGFPDIIEYQGDLWRVVNLVRIEIGHGEDTDSYVGKAKVRLWSEPAHNEVSTEPDQQTHHYRIK